MQKPSLHISGIGGTAMVAGARLALEAGWEVRGSDNPLYPPTSNMVAALGVPVAEGYAAENLDWNPDVVLLGNVLSRGNAEVEAALSRRMRYMSLPEWLKEHVLRTRRPVAICGTHGKTTTTALTAHVLDACGLNPGYFIGGQPLGFEHSARLGAAGAPFVIEGDEYDTAFFDKRAKFLHYIPEIAVVTSMEFDHGDIYRDLDEIDLAFQRMLRQIPKDGWLLACADNRAATLLPHAFSNTATYGFAENADWRGEYADGTLTVYRDGALWTAFTPPMPGQHNQQNALAAAAVAGTLGVSAEAVRDGIASFPGVRRRMEVFLEADNKIFVDDFAHHPTAIRGTIAAARTRWPGHSITVLFEPRSNTTVTDAFREELASAFAQADSVCFGPIYRADRIPPAERLNRDALCASLKQSGVDAHYADETEALLQAATAATPEPTVVLLLSNGAFGGIYDLLKKHYANR